MKTRELGLLAVTIVGSALSTSAAGALRIERRPHYPDRAPVEPTPCNSGAYFEPAPQVEGEPAAFLGRSRGLRTLISANGATFGLPDGSFVRMGLLGSDLGARWEAHSALPGVSNYFLGNDPGLWRTGIRHYSGLRAKSAIPGVDWTWKASGNFIEFGFVVHAGVPNPSLVLTLDGCSEAAVSSSGELQIRVPSGELRFTAPIAYQPTGAGRTEVPVRFVRCGENRIRIDIRGRNPMFPLVIDPRVTFSTYFGGSGSDRAQGIAIDGSGNIYVAGYTTSTNFPALNAFQSMNGNNTGSTDATFSKFDPTGTTLLQSTYLGGSGDDECMGLALDSSGAVHLAGYTTSTNFPLSSPFQATLKGPYDGFIAKFTPNGAGLVYSTYLGGGSTDGIYALALDSAGAVYVTGLTSSTDFPLKDAVQATHKANYQQDAFVTKLNASGSALGFSTYLGGGMQTNGHGIAVDSNGSCVVTGLTTATDFPVASAFQATSGGGQDAFVTKYSASGTAITFSTYLGGNGNDYSRSVRLEGSGTILLTGFTASTNFPTASSFQAANGGDIDAFVTRMAANGSSLVFSTYLGGNGVDVGHSIAPDANGNVFVTGRTKSTNFPTASPVDGTLEGTQDGFLTRIASSGSSLVYSTYIGGDRVDEGMAVAVNGTDPVFAGTTDSLNFPLVSPYQASNGSSTVGVLDYFVARMTTTPLPPSGLSADLSGFDVMELAWIDGSDNETAFQLERKVSGGPFQLIATKSAGETAHTDSGLARGVSFTYRVRAINIDGTSSYSEEAVRATPPTFPGVPLSPTACTATVASSTQVDLMWTDNSDDETFFQVQRQTGTGIWQVLSTPGPNATSMSDTSVRADRSYSYRVRCSSAIGFSDYTNVAVAELPGTLDLDLTKGLLQDSIKPGRDKIALDIQIGLGSGSPNSTIDPQASGVEVRLGGPEGALLLNLAPGIEGWVVKRGIATWKSPKGSPSNAKVIHDPANGILKLRFSKVDLLSPPSSPVMPWVSIGLDAGREETEWYFKKAGVLKFPVPVPK